MFCQLLPARYLFVPVAVVGIWACSGTPAGPSPVLTGSWGGDHIALTVANTGSQVEFDCAHGDIDGALTVNARNEFKVSGTFVREHGGPIRIGEVPDSHPAAYFGSATTTTMALTVQLTDTHEMIGSFTLTRDTRGRVAKCLLPLTAGHHSHSNSGTGSPPSCPTGFSEGWEQRDETIGGPTADSAGPRCPALAGPRAGSFLFRAHWRSFRLGSCRAVSRPRRRFRPVNFPSGRSPPALFPTLRLRSGQAAHSPSRVRAGRLSREAGRLMVDRSSYSFRKAPPAAMGPDDIGFELTIAA